MAQTELRDNLVDKMKSRGENPEKLRDEFDSLTQFESNFYK